jgi:hypothetical protein
MVIIYPMLQHAMPWMENKNIRTFKPDEGENVSALLLVDGDDRWLFF